MHLCLTLHPLDGESGCAPLLVPSLGTTAPRGNFQSNLGHNIHIKYWNKSDIRLHRVARKALASLPESGRQVESLALATKTVASRQVATTSALPSGSEFPVDSLQLCHPHPVTNKREKAACLIAGQKEKNAALDDYQSRFGSGPPITTTVLGTFSNPHLHPLQPPSQYQLIKMCIMKPDPNKYYNAWDIKFHNVLVLVLNMCLGIADLFALSCFSKLLGRTVPHIHRLLQVDWRPLL